MLSFPLPLFNVSPMVPLNSKLGFVHVRGAAGLDAVLRISSST